MDYKILSWRTAEGKKDDKYKNTTECGHSTYHLQLSPEEARYSGLQPVT